MWKGTQVPSVEGGYLESVMARLSGLSQESQAAVAAVIDRLALIEGVSPQVDLKLPLDNIDLWLTKLNSPQKSRG